MKAISLHQPFASAVARGVKLVETRGWATSIRGDIAIHASKHFTIANLRQVRASRAWCDILGVPFVGGGHLWDVLPFGAVIAVVSIVDCRPTESFTNLTEREVALGDYTPGRFGWILDDIRILATPIAAKGRQRIFTLDETTATVVRNGLLVR